MAEMKLNEEEQGYLDSKQSEVTVTPEETPKEEPVADSEAETPVEQPDVKAEEEKPSETPVEGSTPVPEVEVTEERLGRGRVRIETLSQEKKALQEEVERLKSDGMDRLTQLEEQQSLKQDPVPDREYEPEEYIDYQDVRLKEFEEADAQRKEDESQQSDQQAVFKELNDYVVGQEDAFVETHADYFEAIQWGRAERAKQHMETYDINEAAANALTNQEIQNAAVNVRNIGGDTARVFYNEAKKMGWGKESNDGSEAQPNRNNGDLKAVSRGQRAAVNPKGGTSTGSLTLEDVLASSDEEFLKQTYDMKALKKLFGEK